MAGARTSRAPTIIVIGGANLDIKSRVAGKAIAGTSNPGWTETSPGGVGRNIAEGLARLGARVGLLTVIGEDGTGDRLRRSARAAGIDTALMMPRRGATGTYSAVLDAKGEMLIAVSDMRLIDAMKPADIARHKDVLAGADLLVADCNLPAPCLKALARLARDGEIALIVEPVSVPKAARLRDLLKSGAPLRAVTPNRDELAALTGIPTKNATGLTRAAQYLHRRGVEHVLVGLGAAGCWLSSVDDTPTSIPGHKGGRVHDVTGGGDAMVAGFAYGLATHGDARQAAREGQKLAGRLVRSKNA